MSTFRRSLPLTFTSFINRSGSIGLTLIPILLVERQLSVAESSWVMAAVKAGGLIGVVLGGWWGDVLGLRTTLLLSFAIAGIGLAGVPFVGPAWAFALLASLSSVGNTMYYASARLLVTRLVDFKDRNGAIAWQRTANNLAQVISYSVGALLGRFGAIPLILFDAATSILATGVGAWIIPRPSKDYEEERRADTDRRATQRDFMRCAMISASFSFLYEFYMTGAAARCRVIFGESGLAVFSQTMVVNTVLCALLTVQITKRAPRAIIAMPVGLSLLVLGLFVTFSGLGNLKICFFVGIFVMTLGELVFNSMAGLALIQLTPEGRRYGTTYSLGVLLQIGGRIVGAAMAFPLVVASERPVIWITVVAFLPLLLVWSSKRTLNQVR